MKNLNIIKSVNNCQQQILLDIMEIYNISNIDLDFTYSCGNFYKQTKNNNGNIIQVPEPIIKMDVYPQTEDTVKIEKMKGIPLDDNFCNCIVYDPPFVISPYTSASMTTNIKDGSNIIQKRFASFYPHTELLETYYFHMKEMYRLLKDNGYAIVKCQNTVSSRKQINSEEYFWFLGECIGFDMIDKFVLISKSRIIGNYRKQEHSRRFESYFLVFKKSKKLKTKYFSFCDEKLCDELLNNFKENNILNKKKQ